MYVAGKADVGPLSCGCGNSGLDVLGYGMFVVRYDADGQCTQQWSYGENTPPHGLVVDSNGDVLLGGAHGGAFEVQGTMFDAPGGVANMDAYLLRFDKTGALLWGRSFGAPNYHDDVAEIAIGKAGDVFVTGHVSGPVDLGDGVTLEPATTSDLYVARFSGTDGKALWAQRFSNKTVFSTLPASLAIDEQKNVLVGGLFTETIDFGDADSPHVSAGGQDGYLVKLSPD